jgi:hypothetical protein
MPLRGRKVFVIEHSVFILAQIKGALEHAGVDVRSCQSPAKALLDIVHWHPGMGGTGSTPSASCKPPCKIARNVPGASCSGWGKVNGKAKEKAKPRATASAFVKPCGVRRARLAQRSSPYLNSLSYWLFSIKARLLAIIARCAIV